MQIAKTPRIIQCLLPNAIWKKQTQEKVVYLTFDDGPTPVVTEQVLSLLNQYGAKATFFCIGKNVKQHPSIYEKIINHGHSVGNHTHNHLKGWDTPNKDYFKNIEKCSHFVQSNLFRPPYGRIKRSQYNYLTQFYSVIMWDVLSWDFVQSNTPTQCANHVLKNIQYGSIVVFHDSLKAERNCLKSLKIVLEQLHKDGWMFKKLESA